MEVVSKPTRILLVDDSVAVLWGLGKLIQGEYPRMTVIGAVADPEEALVYCDLRPDVTLLDIDLRRGSSLGFIPAIRARSHGEVLIFTGLRDARVHQRARALGALGVIGKDEPGEAVLRAIEQVHAGKPWGGGAAR